MTFTECVMFCAEDRKLLAAFDGLRGTNMCRRGTPFDLAIDDATGKLERDAVLFFEFVYECVWTRVDWSNP
jgi:hypothetical protein